MDTFTSKLAKQYRENVPNVGAVELDDTDLTKPTASPLPNGATLYRGYLIEYVDGKYRATPYPRVGRMRTMQDLDRQWLEIKIDRALKLRERSKK